MAGPDNRIRPGEAESEAGERAAEEAVRAEMEAPVRMLAVCAPARQICRELSGRE